MKKKVFFWSAPLKIKMIKIKIKMMKNPPGPYINHMLESDGVKRRALRARRLERPPIIRVGTLWIYRGGGWRSSEGDAVRVEMRYGL